jgi:hypothetical protein
MEVLLQMWDELDDWYGCVRHVWLGMRTDLTDVPRIEVSLTPAQPVIRPALAPAD